MTRARIYCRLATLVLTVFCQFLALPAFAAPVCSALFGRLSLSQKHADLEENSPERLAGGVMLGSN